MLGRTRASVWRKFQWVSAARQYNRSHYAAAFSDAAAADDDHNNKNKS